MKRFSLGPFIVALVGLAVLLATAKPVHAQGEPDPEPSSNPLVFKEQLLQFTMLTRRNLRDIQALSGDDSIPIDPQLLSNLHRAYVLIRAAQFGISMKVHNASTPDPTLVVAKKRAEDAWNLARYPVDYARQPRGEYIPKSVENLTAALRLSRQALVILP